MTVAPRSAALGPAPPDPVRGDDVFRPGGAVGGAVGCVVGGYGGVVFDSCPLRPETGRQAAGHAGEVGVGVGGDGR